MFSIKYFHNPFTLIAAKIGFMIWKYFGSTGIFWKTFEGEMMIISQRTLLQIFCELSLYLQVTFKSMRVADETV